MKNIFVMISLLFFSPINQAGWIASLTKIGKGTETAVATSKVATGAKGAAATGIAINELDDAAKATRLNLSHPLLPEYETATIINNHYPWAPTRLAQCILKNSNTPNNSAIASCTSKYQKCIDERKIQTTHETPSEACITQTNKEYRNDKN